VRRQVLLLHLAVADHVDGFAFCQERGFFALGGFAEDAIGEFEDRAAQQGGTAFDQNLVVIAGRGAIAAGDFDHRENAAVLLFQLAVREAEGAEQFDAADFEPDEVVGIVDDAHLVGLCVADSDFGGYRHKTVSPSRLICTKFSTWNAISSVIVGVFSGFVGKIASNPARGGQNILVFILQKRV